MTYFLMSWHTMWLFDVLTHYVTFWCPDTLCDFLMSWCTFWCHNVICANLWGHDLLLDVMTYIVFDVMTYFLKWHTFKHHDVLSSLFDIMRYFLTSWCTFLYQEIFSTLFYITTYFMTDIWANNIRFWHRLRSNFVPILMMVLWNHYKGHLNTSFCFVCPTTPLLYIIMMHFDW